MKKIIAMLLLVVMMVGCSGNGETARKTTENALNAIKNMDVTAITKYFGSNAFQDSEKISISKNIVKSLFQNYSYEIVSVEEKEADAIAKLKITNTDMKKIMGDIVPEMLKEALSTAFLPEDQQLTEDEMARKFETMLIDSIGNPDVGLITAEVEVKIIKKDGAWVISATDDFLDAVTGGMLSVSGSMSTNLDNLEVGDKVGGNLENSDNMPDVNGGKGIRKNPAKIGDTMTGDMDSSVYGHGRLEITLTNIVRGNDAAEKIQAENEFNDPPADGKEYILATFTIKNIQDQSGKDEAVEVDYSQFSYASSQYAKSNQMKFFILESQLDMELFEGAETTGDVVLVCDKGDNGYIIYRDVFWFSVA